MPLLGQSGTVRIFSLRFIILEIVFYKFNVLILFGNIVGLIRGIYSFWERVASFDFAQLIRLQVGRVAGCRFNRRLSACLSACLPARQGRQGFEVKDTGGLIL